MNGYAQDSAGFSMKWDASPPHQGRPCAHKTRCDLFAAELVGCRGPPYSHRSRGGQRTLQEGSKNINWRNRYERLCEKH